MCTIMNSSVHTYSNKQTVHNAFTSFQVHYCCLFTMFKYYCCDHFPEDEAYKSMTCTAVQCMCTLWSGKANTSSQIRFPVFYIAITSYKLCVDVISVLSTHVTAPLKHTLNAIQ